MLVLVPVKARNSIDITSTSESTKTRAMTTPSNSLKLPFTDVVDCSLGTDRAMPVPLGHRRKNRPDEGRFTENRQDERYRDALGERVGYSKGRISPGDG